MPATERRPRPEKGINIHRGLALREALRLADALGVTSTYRRGTGEIRFEYPGQKSVLVNSRRKDLPRAALVLLKRACEQQ